MHRNGVLSANFMKKSNFVLEMDIPCTKLLYFGRYCLKNLGSSFLQKLLVSSHVNETVAAEVEEDYLFATLFFGFEGGADGCGYGVG